MDVHTRICAGLVLGGLLSASPAMASGAPVACTVSNLPPTFILSVGERASDGKEAAVVKWPNFPLLLTNVNAYLDAAIGNHCRDASGADIPGYTPQGITLINDTLSMVLRSSDPHYKSVLQMLRYAKVNFLPVNIDIDLLNAWDYKFGWIVDAVEVK